MASSGRHPPGLAQVFAGWAITANLAEAPASALHAARRAMFDTLGVMVAGAHHPKVLALANAIAGQAGPCSVAGHTRSTPMAAAVVNGMAAHVWDYDDNSYTGMIHGSAILLPAVLAAGQSVGATGEALLHAFLIGSEVTYVLGEVATHSHFLAGWWASGSCAVIGATAAVCRLYGMTADQTANAIGMAAVAGAVARAIAGTDSKPYLAGNAAAQAISFADAARAGLTGSQDAFEQTNGFFAMLNGGHSLPAMAADLGQRWRTETPGLLFKTSPVCSAAHAAIEAVTILLEKTGAGAADIAAIHAEIPRLVAASLVYDRPEGPQQAQFSLPYCVACAVLHGRVRLQDLVGAELADPAKRDLMGRVTTAEAADLSTEAMQARFPESARLTLTLKDGRSASHFCGEAFGMPARPLSDQDLTRKFADCLGFAGQEVPATDLARDDMLALAERILGPKGTTC
ncbi:MAG: MmgE/PrpD family protein [Paracoccaceae bacterium]